MGKPRTTLGERIKRARQYKKMSLTKLVISIGQDVRLQKILDIENGDAVIEDPDMLNNIARVLEISQSELIELNLKAIDKVVQSQCAKEDLKERMAPLAQEK